ncbi:hypothetical protein [Stratiformator vulcanicus]|uniref:Uncharacterized protein n=1 Tax=Stratiformator vulcanicus TaxID=2527980 RepID=A0A517R704_9PLAN|nr:hypothetical protein [Stratiformator vulcanicus]QDT39668.1 hypothetical protein Pan189_40770 [Stratiformator vulcanicus]
MKLGDRAAACLAAVVIGLPVLHQCDLLDPWLAWEVYRVRESKCDIRLGTGILENIPDRHLCDWERRVFGEHWHTGFASEGFARRWLNFSDVDRSPFVRHADSYNEYQSISGWARITLGVNSYSSQRVSVGAMLALARHVQGSYAAHAGHDERYRLRGALRIERDQNLFRPDRSSVDRFEWSTPIDYQQVAHRIEQGWFNGLPRDVELFRYLETKLKRF